MAEIWQTLGSSNYTIPMATCWQRSTGLKRLFHGEWWRKRLDGHHRIFRHDLFSPNRDLWGRFDTQADLPAPDFDYGDGDLGVNY
jgi:hypothetical protein